MAAEGRQRSLVVEIPHGVDEEVLAGLCISVDGRTDGHALPQAHGAVVATAPSPGAAC